MQNTFKHIKDSLDGYYDKAEAYGISRHVIEEITGLPLSTILFDKSKQITTEQRTSVEEIIRRLQNFEPIQYILGHTEFYGSIFNLREGVLIPRPETEELIELIIKTNKTANPRILDIGTGSGCIAISLAKNIQLSNVSAWDISPQALEVAKENAINNGVPIDFNLVDVLQKVHTEKKFDIIVSNPPYVLESEKELMDPNVLDHEPHTALFVPDNQALIFYERIADLAKELLVPNGNLFFEINSMKGKETVQMLEDKGFSSIELHQDISGNDRMIKASL